MGFSKTEINLRRLLNAAPRQQNQAKLMHYVATLRELLEELVAETTPEGLPRGITACLLWAGSQPTYLNEAVDLYANRLKLNYARAIGLFNINRISKAMVNDYSEKIEALAAKLASLPSDMPGSVDAVNRTVDEQPSIKIEEQTQVPSPRLRRRLVSHPKVEDQHPEITESDPSTPVKLDSAAQAHIEKHRKLQDDLTDEMVGLARQLKESSLMMSQSLQDTEKLLDSTEKAVEHSLASTGHANTRAMQIYSQSFKTTCFTWLIIFFMTCIFIMVVLLIRVT